MNRLLAILAALTFAGTAQAAGLPQLRAEVAAADSKVATVRAHRFELQKSLDQLAGQIESRKAAKSGQLFGDAELDDLLKKSQTLSTRMTDALKAENEAEDALRGGQAKMVSELDTELSRLRARWDASKTREERQGLIGQLKSLRAERDSLRRAMPATMVPQISDRPSDNPEELLERADALLDGEDKLRREEQALAKRIAELKAERDLERRMNEFLSEDALFDENDRRLSVTRSTGLSPAGGESSPTTAADGASSKRTGDPTPSVSSPFEGNSPTTGALDGTRTNPPSYADTNSSKESGGWGPTPGGTSTGTSTGGTAPGRQDGASAVAAPRVDVTKTPPERRTSVAPYSDDESLDELLGRRAQIQKVADELHKKATEASEKAKALK